VPPVRIGLVTVSAALVTPQCADDVCGEFGI
jgi:hypothetical protein